MFCKNCGGEIREGTLFCPHCGAKVNAGRAAVSGRKGSAGQGKDIGKRGNAGWMAGPGQRGAERKACRAVLLSLAAAVVLMVLVISLAVFLRGYMSVNRNPGDDLYADGNQTDQSQPGQSQSGQPQSVQPQDAGTQDSGQDTGASEDSASQQDTSSYHGNAMDMYAAFLHNEIPIAQGGYDETVGGYYLSDLVKNEDFQESNGDIPVQSAQYTYIDCGKDGKEEMAIRLMGDRYAVSAFVLSWLDGQLVCCYAYEDWRGGGWRTTELNEYGLVNMTGGAGTGCGVGMQGFIGADGGWHALLSYYTETNPEITELMRRDTPYQNSGSEIGDGEITELYNIIIENGCLPEGHWLTVIQVILEATGDQAEELCLTYEVSDQGNVLSEEEIYSYSGGYYKEIFDKAAVPFHTPDEIARRVKERAILLGAAEIFDGAAANWMDLDISAYL